MTLEKKPAFFSYDLQHNTILIQNESPSTSKNLDKGHSTGVGFQRCKVDTQAESKLVGGPPIEAGRGAGPADPSVTAARVMDQFHTLGPLADGLDSSNHIWTHLDLQFLVRKLLIRSHFCLKMYWLMLIVLQRPIASLLRVLRG